MIFLQKVADPVAKLQQLLGPDVVLAGRAQPPAACAEPPRHQPPRHRIRRKPHEPPSEIDYEEGQAGPEHYRADMTPSCAP
jgi:hypothetical protein